MRFPWKIYQLDSGLRAVVVPMAVPSVTALVMVKVGSRNEPKDLRGVSHLVEHMVFKGTKKYPTALKLASAVDAVGASFNAFTSKEYTGFYIKAASVHLDLALTVLAELIFRPLLDQEQLRREKRVVLEEINMIEDQPMRKVGDYFERLLYGTSSLGWEVIGSKQTVSKMGRTDLVKHMKQWYGPENMVLGVAGDARRIENGKRKIENLVEKHFGIKGQVSRRIDKQEGKRDRFPAEQRKPKVKVYNKETEQAHFCLGMKGLPRGHKDRYVAAVLSTILGGNMSSRLFHEIRERRGLAYYVRTSLGIYQDTGSLVTQAGVGIRNLVEAAKLTIKAYHKISKGVLVHQGELKRAKDYLRGRLIIDLEDSQEVASLFGRSLLLEERVRTPEEVVAGIERVTKEDVGRVAEKLLVKERLNLAAVGPYKEEGKFGAELREVLAD
jgi:predicted Zn-dependent peptidase